MGIIKNVPPITFGIVGNRGALFPLVDIGPSLTAPVDESCFLIEEQDENMSIYTQYDKQINIECTFLSVTGCS